MKRLSHDPMAGPPPLPSMRKPARRAVFLPWLLLLLGGAAVVAWIAGDLDQRRLARERLSAARDETAEVRRLLRRAEERIAATSERAQSAERQATEMEYALAARNFERNRNETVISDLKAQLGSKDGDVSIEANRISVNLVDRILFKSGDAELSPGGKELLGRLGAVLKKLGDKQILIGGHADDTPIHNDQFPSNWELSAMRAVHVVRYLGETVGVDARRLTAAGFGHFHPRSRDKAKNRRIEILLTPLVAVK